MDIFKLSPKSSMSSLSKPLILCLLSKITSGTSYFSKYCKNIDDHIQFAIDLYKLLVEQSDHIIKTKWLTFLQNQNFFADETDKLQFSVWKTDKVVHEINFFEKIVPSATVGSRTQENNI